MLELTKKYKDKNGIEIFQAAKGGPYSQEGIWHSMQHLETLDAKKVKKIDAKFEVEGTPCDNCKFDVELEVQELGDLKFIEHKAYLNPSLIPLKQFKQYYLSSVDDLKELQYVFSKAKLGGDATVALEKAKKGMLSIFKNKAETLWEVNEDLFNKMIRMNF